MTNENPNSRLEAFCDGVFAIAITLLIIDIKIPSSEFINNTTEFWNALKHIAPSVFAFLLSFTVILITWVNHHANLKLISKSSHPFIYANGFFLLTVVFLPFPTSLLGEYVLSDYASPAVMLYCVLCALQAVGWFLLTRAELKPIPLTKNEKSTLAIQKNHKYSYFAFIIYTSFAIAAIWFPLIIAALLTGFWVIWLIVGIKIKEDNNGLLSTSK